MVLRLIAFQFIKTPRQRHKLTLRMWSFFF